MTTGIITLLSLLVNRECANNSVKLTQKDGRENLVATVKLGFTRFFWQLTPIVSLARAKSDGKIGISRISETYKKKV